jgi:hypothetical protein
LWCCHSLSLRYNNYGECGYFRNGDQGMLKHLFLAVFLFASSDLVWSQEPPKAPQVEPKQQPESGLKAQKDRSQQTAPPTQPLPSVPEISTERTDRKGQSKSKEGSEQGTEFWPPLYTTGLKSLIRFWLASHFCFSSPPLHCGWPLKGS